MTQGGPDTQSMAFANTNLGAATTDNKNGSGSAYNPFGHTGNAWGSSKIWGNNTNGALSSGFTSKSATRDNSRSRDAALNASKIRAAEIEGKTGSGSLVDDSVQDEWTIRSTYSAPRSVASTRSTSQVRHPDSSVSQQRSASNAGLQGLAGANTTAGMYSSRPPTISLNTTSAAQHRPSFGAPFASTLGGRNSDQGNGLYTKFDRPTESQRKPDSAVGSWAENNSVSPTDDRRVPYHSNQFGKSSVPSSRDQSLQPSQHNGERPLFTQPDYSNNSHSITPLSSRAPSISSQRNGSYHALAANNQDYVASQLGQMNLGGDSRSSVSRRSAGSNSQWSGQNGSLSLSRPSTNGTSHGSPSDDIDFDRSTNYLGISDATYPSANNAIHDYTHGSLNGRSMQTPTGFDYRNGQTLGSANVAPRAFDPPTAPRHNSNWQNYPGDDDTITGRSNGIQPQQYLDPQIQQAIAAQIQLRANMSLYNPYALQSALQLQNQAQYLPMFQVPLNGVDANAGSRDPPPGDGVQSALMYEFRTNTKSKRYELKDIYDHIAEFSGDQHGSRFIQTKLETANSDEKERVFREIQPNAIPLMTDVFGNYVIQKFFEHGDQTHKKILAHKMTGQVLNLSLQMYGCRVVQKALDHVLVDQQAALVSELQGHVLKCVKDQNGNHVIQKAIERCPPNTIGFIIDAFRGQVQHLSVHPYGCRVIQRCLEHCDTLAKSFIMNELMDGLQGMIADQYGNYVVQHIVSKDEGQGRQEVLQIVGKGLEGYSKHKFASNVVEKCLEMAGDAWRKEVVCTLANGQRRVEGEGVLVGLLKDNFGNYVIQKLLDTLSAEDYINFLDLLHPAVTAAKRTGCGKQIMSIEKKMHRFQSYRNNTNNSSPMSASFNPQNQMPMLTSPFASHFNTPPLSAEAQRFQQPNMANMNGDTVGGATANSRKGSEQSNDSSFLRR